MLKIKMSCEQKKSVERRIDPAPENQRKTNESEIIKKAIDFETIKPETWLTNVPIYKMEILILRLVECSHNLTQTINPS